MIILRRDPSPAMTSPTPPFEALGGVDGVRALVDRFYDLLDSSPEAADVRRLHAASLSRSREKLFEYLTGWTGGPPLYESKYGHPRLRGRHLPFVIGARERDQWLWCMDRALDGREMPTDVREFLRSKLHQLADHMRNQDEPLSRPALPHIPPMSVVNDLLALLDLEPLEVNIYRGQSRDLGTGRVFGGQVFAQALVAARRTVPDGREAHSVHGYFLREGDFKAPIVYFVDRPRDGRSFTSRRVTAIQHGEAIFHLSASFHIAEPGLEHQTAMPVVPAPESLPSELDLIRARADQIPEPLRSIVTQERPIDIRPITPPDPYLKPAAGSAVDARRQVWFRVVERIPDTPLLHQAILAYASDYGFLPTALLPHGVTYRDPRLFMASLDHTVWMHRPFRADEWLLYVSDTPAGFGSRGFVRGQVFTQDGTLVASVAQEGLIRLREPKAP